MIDKAPIVLFVYNRADVTEQTLEALSNNELASDSTLYIYCDGPKQQESFKDIEKIVATRRVANSKQWCKKVIIKEAAVNIGLANSIINGVSSVLKKHDRVIVLEDDLVTSKGFLTYMNMALEKYYINEEVMQVSGYNFPLKRKAKNESFFLPLTTSWGWGTWSRAWKKFDTNAIGYEILKEDNKAEYKFNLDGCYPYSRMLFAQMESTTIDSWAIKWWWSVFKEYGLTVYPDKSLVFNNGFSEDATHTSSINNHINNSDFDFEYQIKVFPSKIEVNRIFFKQVKNAILEMQGIRQINLLEKTFNKVVNFIIR